MSTHTIRRLTYTPGVDAAPIHELENFDADHVTAVDRWIRERAKAPRHVQITLYRNARGTKLREGWGRA